MIKKIPKHLAIIMDGNRRWARAHNLPTLTGHKRGYNKLQELGSWCLEQGVKYFTVFAFSTENWQRSKKEVDYLMRLLKRAVTVEIKKYMKENIRLRIIGQREGLNKELQQAIKTAEEKTSKNTKGTLILAINYGGQVEITDAVKKIIKKKIPVSKINEQLIAKNLYAPDVPPPDLIIRTSGEQRLSGFLLWGSSYAEFYFTKKHWPVFTKKDLELAFKDFAKRQRRFGGN